MAFQFNEEKVLVAIAGMGNDSIQVKIKLIAIEDLHRFCQCSALVTDLEHQRRFIITRSLRNFITNDRKSRYIECIVFDVGCNHIESKMDSSFSRRNRYDTRLLAASFAAAVVLAISTNRTRGDALEAKLGIAIGLVAYYELLESLRGSTDLTNNDG